MNLTRDNYHSQEANLEYMSFSLLKSLNWGCAAKEMAILKGDLKKEQKTCFLEGSLFHSWFEGEEAYKNFKDNNPEIYAKTGKNKGELKSDFKLIEIMIESVKKDQYLMGLINHPKIEHEKIITFEILGVKCKTQIDLFVSDEFVLEIKSTNDLLKKFYSTEKNHYVNFIEYNHYLLQAFFYSLGLETCGYQFKEYLMLAVSKEEKPKKELLNIGDQVYFEANFAEKFPYWLEYAVAVRDGNIEAKRCEKCDYCYETKKIEKARPWYEI